jgi:hypothetical protein
MQLHTADRIDLAAGVLVFESLKKRRIGIFRSVPVPPALLDTIDMVHGIRELHARRGKGRGVRLWPWSRTTAVYANAVGAEEKDIARRMWVKRRRCPTLRLNAKYHAIANHRLVAS